jgi:hypothetical protein
MEPPSFRGVWFPRGFAEPSGWRVACARVRE